MVRVTWQDALAYCQWLSSVTGKKSITLSSEAEWERAARGDKDKRRYPWGDAFEEDRCNGSALGLGTTTPVGIFPEGASPDGCLDMAGNVWEWTRSLYGKYPYPGAGDPDRRKRENLDDTEGRRVLRGGSFFSESDDLRCACRSGVSPIFQSYGGCGFRVILPGGSDAG